MDELRIGVHANDRSLVALRRCGILEELLEERGAQAVWVEYDDSRRTIDLLCAGELHVAGTGIAPPLRAQSEGVDIVYVAVSPEVQARGRLLVRGASGARSVADLAGARVAVQRGSGPTHVLATVLGHAGLGYRDVDVVLRSPDVAAQALREGEVDAWLDSAPTPVVAPAPPPAPEGSGAGGGLRALSGGSAVVADRTVWFARRDVAVEHPELVESVVVALRRPPCAAQPVSRAFLAEQQRVADLFAGQGVIALPVNVGAAVAPLFVTA
jgi:sulfonate transport system substrate-binding protein